MSNITVPYSVNAINGHSGNMTRGTYNFTTTIELKKVQPTYLWFQHADQSADIYVDDVKVTTHWGGYNAFFTDISNYVHVGINNIKVALCNTIRNELAPSAGDFNFNATLGKVKVFTSPVLPSMIYGYDGFHITATNVSSSAATLTIKTNVPVGAMLVCKIDDDDSNYHFVEKKPSTGNEVTFTTTISNPTLWDGLANPHLYNVTLEIYKNGDLYHRYQRGYGIRYYDYVFNQPGYVENENYTGFLLNGHPYKLRGVCMHHDIEGKANALSDTDVANDFAIIQELGCNFIRLAHYPHTKEVYDWCDRLGIIVQTEVPCVNRFNSPEVSGTNCPQAYYDHLDIQYEDMVRQHFNHPCIMFWGLFNEAGSPNDSSWAKTKLEYYRTLIRNIDSERWVGYVAPQGQSNPSSYMGNPDMDWYGCNIYVGWYTNNGQSNGTLSNNPSSALTTRVNNIINTKQKPLAYSEYGCGGTSTCHSDNFTDTTTRGNNPRHDIEYMMWLHEGHIAAIKTFPQLLFSSQWQLFDIAVSSRQEGYKECLDGVTVTDNNNLKYLNNKGLVERDHQTKKDTFYLYKAWWNPTPFVHICQKNYEKVDNRVIKCYTNDGDTMTLYVNNTEIETVNVTNNIATFTARNFNNNDVIKVEGDSTYESYTIHSHNYSNDYLTFDIKSDGSIIWKRNTAGWGTSITDKTIYYSKNDGSWTSLTSSTEGTSISVTTGDKLVFRGFNDYYATYDSPQGGPRYYSNIVFSGTAGFNVYGNILSLIYGNTFANYNSFVSNTNSVFYGLFKNAKVLSAENLILPVSSLVEYCYCQMFNGCTTLTTAPELPATTLAGSCYYNMFQDCTSLTTAPELPATTLVGSSYAGMFYGCTSLTTAPELPATTLAELCYANMFRGCTSLTTAPELPATTLGSMCYYQMFSECSSLTTAPELPATTLTTYSYYYMFRNCTHINYIKCLAKDITASYCTTNWVENVAATGTFVKDSKMSSWTTGNDGIPSGWTVENYNTHKDEYLTFDIKSNGNITWKMGSSSAIPKTISYSKNNGTWTNITSTTSGVSIPVVTGDKVRFKGSNSTYATYRTYSYINSFGGTVTFDVYGNIMSLIGGDNFSNLTTLSSTYTFYGLFQNCTGLTSTENLILPATTLTDYCYYYMFSGCSSLTTAPELPATTLTDYCYTNMFYNCTSLTTVPELPATTLADSCYYSMFNGCTSLTSAPSILPSTTLADFCYRAMFNGCTSLTTTPSILPATTLANYCYDSMFADCTSLTTAPELPATTLAENCYYGMFYGCTSLTTAPVLPATTLVTDCYRIMFQDCTNLNYIKCLATSISGTYYWVDGVSATGTFVKDSKMSSWTTGVSGIPSGWVVEDDYTNEYLTFDVKSDGNITWKMNSSSATAKTISYSKNDGTWTDITSTTSGVSIPVVTGDKVRFKGSNSAYATSSTTNSFGGTATFDVYGNIMSLIGGDNFSNLTTLSSYTFAYLFFNCTGLLSSENLILPATTLASDCYDNMFSSCTSLTTAPELPATTLASYCYYEMFYGCTSLTTAPELPVTTLASNCYNCYSGMFSGCTSLTTAPELPATTLTASCYQDMFSNCTSLTTAPELPATTLVQYCYKNMFSGCTNLNYIKCLATNISSAYDCLTNWVDGVAASGTFVKADNMSGWTVNSVNGIPSGWTAYTETEYAANGHAYVEIAGIKWATMNVGATSETDYGTYFAWGETSGKSDYSFSTYAHGTSSSNLWKYNSTDGKTELELEDDAARANWGGQWVMPTDADFQSLIDNTTNEWVTDYNGSGIKGRIFTDKTDSSKKLFFPMAGCKINTSTYDVGSYAYVWSSTRNSSVYSGKQLYFNNSSVGISGGAREYGGSVRPCIRTQS